MVVKVSAFLNEVNQKNPGTIEGFCNILGYGDFRDETSDEHAGQVVAKARSLTKGLGLTGALLWINGMRDPAGTSRHFTNLDVNLVACQLTMRILQPHRFNQGGFNLCGPAAFVMMMAQSRPEELMKFASGLLANGQSSISGWDIVPDDCIKQYNPTSTGRLAEADWLLMASVRDRVMAEDEKQGQYGGSTISEMHQWLKKAGYLTICGLPTREAFATTGFTGLIASSYLSVATVQEYTPSKPSFLNALSASDAMDPNKSLALVHAFMRNKWAVLLGTSEALAGGGTSAESYKGQALDKLKDRLGGTLPEGFNAHVGQREVSTAGKADHWLLLQKFELNTVAKTVSFEAYTWGGSCTISNLAVDKFVGDYGGFVAANSRDITAVEKDWIG